MDTVHKPQHTQLITTIQVRYGHVSKYDHVSITALFVNFELVVLGGSTVDELSAALCFALIVVPILKIL